MVNRNEEVLSRFFKNYKVWLIWLKQWLDFVKTEQGKSLLEISKDMRISDEKLFHTYLSFRLGDNISNEILKEYFENAFGKQEMRELHEEQSEMENMYFVGVFEYLKKGASHSFWDDVRQRLSMERNARTVIFWGITGLTCSALVQYAGAVGVSSQSLSISVALVGVLYPLYFLVEVIRKQMREAEERAEEEKEKEGWCPFFGRFVLTGAVAVTSACIASAFSESLIGPVLFIAPLVFIATGALDAAVEGISLLIDKAERYCSVRQANSWQIG